MIVMVGGRILVGGCLRASTVSHRGPGSFHMTRYPTVDTKPGFEDSLIPIIRHPNSGRFHELLAEAGRLHDKKQTDYGRTDDPFANVRASEEWGIDGWVGAMIRATDKVRRLQTLA